MGLLGGLLDLVGSVVTNLAGVVGGLGGVLF